MTSQLVSIGDVDKVHAQRAIKWLRVQHSLLAFYDEEDKSLNIKRWRAQARWFALSSSKSA